jgi:hypothetical protein
MIYKDSIFSVEKPRYRISSERPMTTLCSAAVPVSMTREFINLNMYLTINYQTLIELFSKIV